MNDKLVIIDAYGLLFRAYFALPKLTSKEGVHIGAISGFLNMLIKIIDNIKCDYILIARDAKGDNFRHDIYKDYKANREAAPEELIGQFSILQEALNAFEISNMHAVGYEADDIIATIVKNYSKEMDICVISSDKDLFQLMTYGVKIFDSMKDKYVDEEYVKGKFGVEPEKLLDCLALMGDKSDNIPGVPSIGVKTAAQLINDFGSLENLYNNLSEIKQIKRRDALELNRDSAFMSKKLITLNTDVPLDFSLDDLKFKLEYTEKINDFFKKYDFTTLSDRLKKRFSWKEDIEESIIDCDVEDVKITKHEVIEITTEKDLKYLSKTAIYEGIIAIDYSSEGQISGNISIGFSSGKCFIESAEHNSRDKLISILKNIFQDDSIIKICFDVNNINKLFDVTVSNYDDLQVMYATIYTGTKVDIPDMWNKYFGDDNLEKNKVMKFIPLYNKMKLDIIDNGIYSLYTYFDKPLMNKLITMKRNGILVNKDILLELSEEFKSDLRGIEAEIYQEAGTVFNIASPKQVGSILFDKLGIEGGKKSKTGAYVTDVSVLEKLNNEQYRIAGLILNWRKISKLISTYVDSLIGHINNDTGRVHTSYSMISTNTGRLSSSNPNLQNIPIRDVDGNRIRKAFEAGEGKTLISFDYSQIELRLLAEMADVKLLKKAFDDGIDVHSVTATQMFGIDIDSVTSEYRRKAKTINFGIIYGISAFGLSERLGITTNEASLYIKSYFECYPEIKNYMDRQIMFAKENGYVLTYFNRKCYMTNINSSNRTLRNFSERAAINAPLQGTASDIMRRAVIEVDNAIDNKISAKMLLQIHDELLLEVTKGCEVEVIEIVKKCMEYVSEIGNIYIPVNVLSGECLSMMEEIK